jgi:hypothetical protein
MRSSAVFFAALAWTAPSAAQGVRPPAHEWHPVFDPAVQAPTNALELGARLGCGAAFGDVRTGVPRYNLGALGGTAEIGLGYRATPELMLGTYAQGAFYGTGTGTTTNQRPNIFGTLFGVEATLHTRPRRALDPWLALGTGWRTHWTTFPGQSTTIRHGWEIARAQIGLDFRATPQIAISPVLGADVSIFLYESPPGVADFRAIPGRLNSFVFAGFVGHFDFGGETPRAGTTFAGL